MWFNEHIPHFQLKVEFLLFSILSAQNLKKKKYSFALNCRGIV